MEQRFENQTALVVGGANGIGRAIALRLGQEGARVMIADTLQESEAGFSVCQQIRSMKAQSDFFECDVREDYRAVHQACHDTAAYLAREIAKLGPFGIIYDGKGGLPAVCWTLNDGANPGFTLYDFADRLRNRGWQVPAYSMPPNRSDLVVQRILVRHGFSRDLGDLLLDDFRHALDYFAQHPVATPLLEHEAGGHNHTGRYKKKHETAKI